jgi:hypothetical protein
MMPKRWLLLPLLPLALSLVLRADGPADNQVDKVRPVPPPGVVVPDADRQELEKGVDELARQIVALRDSLEAKPKLLVLLPDVQIYEKAVRWALSHNEFFNVREVAVAKKLLGQGMARAELLRDGKAPWDAATGLVVRGYISRIDGSVQPYGLVVPASYQPDAPQQFRLDVWCHGRGENLSELSFINGRQSSIGEFAPPNAFVVHPYGRYCNANKFAGEIDLFEAIADIKKHYPIDEDRMAMRGFSMGGAACWQFAVHYPSIWVAAAPGAGFSETADFLKVFQNESVKPPWYEQKLWHLYDCTDYALNLFNCPTVAYSGEVDRQKQAADMMAQALAKEGIELVHLIGAKAPHRYTPEAKVEINRRIDSIVKVGRDPVPVKVRFTTWTLRYNRSFWVQVDGLEQHWERARVDADLFGREGLGPEIITKNVSALTLTMPPGHYPPELDTKPSMTIDGEKVDARGVLSDRSWTAHFRKVNSHWQAADSDNDGTTVRKRHGLQGPIDDAFMDSFLMVRPTGAAINEKVGRWAGVEMRHAVDHWRRQFRGEARLEDDKDVTEADIAAHNLILWGDPGSNSLIAKIVDKLPVQWQKDVVRLGTKTYDAGHHVPVLICPNPLNAKRYVVLNSGFTFREYDYLNNARQVPKLPDFAVLDVDVPVSSRAAGGVVAAGFFTEEWRLPPAQ